MQRIDISPPFGVLDEIAAAGPMPALVMALTLTVYLVMTPFCFSTGTGDEESSAAVGSLC